MLKFLTFIFVLLFLTFLYRLITYKFSTKEAIKIDNTYVINLDRSENRMRMSDLNFKSIGMNYERLRATDAYREIKIYEIKEGGDIELDLNNIKNARSSEGSYGFQRNKDYRVFCDNNFSFVYKTIGHNRSNRDWTVGEFGCACSHFRAMKKIIENNSDYGLIFEDDFIFLNEFKIYFENILKDYDKSCDALFLYHNKFIKTLSPALNKIVSVMKNRYNPYVSHVETFKSMSGMVSYIVSKNAAKIVIEDLEKNGVNNSYEGVDHYFMHDIIIDRKLLKGCISNKNIVSWADKFTSDINLTDENK